MLAKPPLDPSSGQARRWLDHELSKAKYGDQHNLIGRLTDWLGRQFDHLTKGSGALDPTTLVVVLVVLAALIGVGLTRVRLDRPTRTAAGDDGVFGDDVRSARELREQARRARSAGDLDAAFLAWFRAIARSGVERVLVPERVGATAHEVADQLAEAFPDRRDELGSVAAIFDRIRYGDRHAATDDVDLAEALDDALTRSRPAGVAS